MHAPLIFLYWPFALRTGLRISQYPVKDHAQKHNKLANPT
jgi:hypothetical protein